MALRMIEVFLPKAARTKVEIALEGKTVCDIWWDELSDKMLAVKILIHSEESQELLDVLEKKFALVDKFRIILFPVEATIPRVTAAEESSSQNGTGTEKKDTKQPRIPTISREELYGDIEDTIRFSWLHLLLVILSAIVAAVGIIGDNVAVIIGAMVIAPLLGPNVALSLATTLGDMDLARRALKANLLGIAIALFFSAVLGYLFGIPTENGEFIHEVQSRTEVSVADMVLALAAGSAAALSFTAKAHSTLIGVMVAVALLPPLVVFGMLLGAGELYEARGALLLLLVNLIGINLSGVMVFLLQGILPLYWWEANKAKKATRIALTLWIILLVVLSVVIVLSQR